MAGTRLTCMMDDHDIRETEQVIQCYQSLHHRRSVSAHVPENDGICLRSVGSTFSKNHLIRNAAYQPDPGLGISLGYSVGLRR